MRVMRRSSGAAAAETMPNGLLPDLRGVVSIPHRAVRVAPRSMDVTAAAKVAITAVVVILGPIDLLRLKRRRWQ